MRATARSRAVPILPRRRRSRAAAAEPQPAANGC